MTPAMCLGAPNGFGHDRTGRRAHFGIVFHVKQNVLGLARQSRVPAASRAAPGPASALEENG